MKAIFYSIILLLIPASAFSQTVSYSMGVISFTLTSCNKNRALSSIDFFTADVYINDKLYKKIPIKKGYK